MSEPRRWFRFYTQTLFSGKVQNLDGNSFKTLINLWCCFAHHGGKLPEIPALAFELRLRESTLRKQLDELVKQGLIDCNEGTYVPHDWEDWQYASDVSTDRVRRYRSAHETFPKQRGNVSETPRARSDTDTDTETENPLPPLTPSAPSARRSDHSFERFEVAFLQARPNTLPEEFAAASDRWAAMPIADRAKAVRGIQDRIDGQVWTDPNFVMAPAKYLTAEYKRVVIPRSNEQAAAPTEKRIPTYDELRAKGLV